MSKTHRSYVAQFVETNCKPWEARHVKPAFAGDVEAAFALSCALDNSMRGVVALAMWRAKVPTDAFRAFFASVWDHNHREVIETATNRRTLAHMFRYAAFPLPAGMPDTVTLWRSTSAVSLPEARAGYSWTTDRDTACWFAMRFAGFNESPLVLTTTISKTEIVLFHTNRGEDEAVLIRQPASLTVDGTPDDWRQGHARCAEAIKAHNAAMTV